MGDKNDRNSVGESVSSGRRWEKMDRESRVLWW